MKYPSSLLLITLLAGVLACENDKKTSPAVEASQANPSTNDFQANDQTWVHAAKGLTLRETPDPKGKPLGLLAYGSEVKILETAKPEHAHVAEKYQGWELKGHWIKVDAEGKRGYVFDAYLAPFPTIAEEPEEGREELDWFYQTLSDLKGAQTPIKPNPEKGIVEGYSQAYADGSRFEFTYYEGGSTQSLEIPSSRMSLERALVVVRALVFRNAKKIDTNWSEEEQVLIISSPEDLYAYFQLNIEEKEGKIIINAMTAD
jgi:hypothetical protein